jgi:hypothetical protein
LMQDPGYRLPRIHLPRTPVNKGKEKDRSLQMPRSVSPLFVCSGRLRQRREASR